MTVMTPLISPQMSQPGAPVIAVELVRPAMMPSLPATDHTRHALVHMMPQFEPLLYWIHHLNRPDCHSLHGIKPAFCLNWSQIVAINAGTFRGLSLNSRLLSVFPSFESFCDPFYVQPPLPRHHSWGGSYMFPHLGKCALFLRPFPI